MLFDIGLPRRTTFIMQQYTPCTVQFICFPLPCGIDPRKHRLMLSFPSVGGSSCYNILYTIGVYFVKCTRGKNHIEFCKIFG